MKRDIALLKNHPFAAVVIGGGIHGATIFHQLAAAGLRVALVEKDDFGGGTSANSLKILHSGLRYLQHLNFKRIRESIRSRKYFMQMAPHLIRPMPCIMPTYGLGIEGRPVMAIALAPLRPHRLRPEPGRPGRKPGRPRQDPVPPRMPEDRSGHQARGPDRGCPVVR